MGQRNAESSIKDSTGYSTAKPGPPPSPKMGCEESFPPLGPWRPQAPWSETRAGAPVGPGARAFPQRGPQLGGTAGQDGRLAGAAASPAQDLNHSSGAFQSPSPSCAGGACGMREGAPASELIGPRRFGSPALPDAFQTPGAQSGTCHSVRAAKPTGKGADRDEARLPWHRGPPVLSLPLQSPRGSATSLSSRHLKWGLRTGTTMGPALGFHRAAGD